MTDLIEHIRNGGEVRTREGRVCDIEIRDDRILGYVMGSTAPDFWNWLGDPLSLPSGYRLTPVTVKPKRFEGWVKTQLFPYQDEIVKEEPHFAASIHVREVLPGDIDPDVARELADTVENYLGSFDGARPHLSPSTRLLKDALAKAKGEG